MKNIVAIDVGNSETTVGVGNNLSWRSYRYTTRKTITSDELFMMFKTTIDPESINDENLDGSIICSVVPQITESVVEATERFTSKKVYTVGPGIKTGLKVNIDNPKELGPDRIANSVGGFKMAQKSVIIVDLGTATTFDVVGKDGAYLGGAIAPGVSVSIKALHDAAAALPYVDVRRPDNVIGKNTKDCIQSGVFWGYIGLIEGIINKIRSEFSDKMTTVATGGLAPLFGRETKIFDFIDLDITMHGMNVIYNFNQSKK